MSNPTAAERNPRIVVMVAAYNEEQYLHETIPAILAQTMPDFTLQLVDNGSTDLTRALLDGYALFDDRLAVVSSDTNLLPGVAMNRYMRYALHRWPDCRWFVAAGADDIMAPEYLERILSAADSDRESNLIFSPWQWIGHPERGVKYFPRFNPEACHAEHQIPAWSAIRRDLWESSGGHDESMIAADWDWVVRNREKIVPHQLLAPYISLRVREGARVTQSEEVHWPTLHRHLCELAGKPTPDWATNCRQAC